MAIGLSTSWDLTRTAIEARRAGLIPPYGGRLDPPESDGRVQAKISLHWSSQLSVDTFSLGFVGRFKLLRAHAPEMTVPPGGIVE